MFGLGDAAVSDFRMSDAASPNSAIEAKKSRSRVFLRRLCLASAQ